MPKITTKFIKDNVLPKNGKFKRTTKRKFEYFNEVCHEDYGNTPTFVLNGKLNWRRYDDEEQNYWGGYYVIDDGENILYHGQSAWLPMSCFDFSYDIDNEYLTVWAFYKEEFEDLGHYGDNLRDDSIAGLVALFRQNGMTFANSMECAWECLFDEKKHFNLDGGVAEANEFFKKLIAPYKMGFIGYAPNGDIDADQDDVEFEDELVEDVRQSHKKWLENREPLEFTTVPTPTKLTWPWES